MVLVTNRQAAINEATFRKNPLDNLSDLPTPPKAVTEVAIEMVEQRAQTDIESGEQLPVDLPGRVAVLEPSRLGDDEYRPNCHSMKSKYVCLISCGLTVIIVLITCARLGLFSQNDS